MKTRDDNSRVAVPFTRGFRARSTALRARLRNSARQLAESARTLWCDESGVILPYVTVMLPVLVGFSLLAVDASRFMSLQTQMQAAADNLALAGARELNKATGAQARAISAMANAYASSKSANTTVGMNSPAPTLTYTYAFYSSLSAASAGIGGTAAVGDGNSKYVKVSVDAVTVDMIFPASFLGAALNSFSAGGTAVAGYIGEIACGVAPMFICNPYEGAVTGNGQTDDANATAALYSNFASASVLRRQWALTRGNNSAAGPGHFGWLQTSDGCNNTSCMRTNIENINANVCYNSTGVSLSTGNKNSVEPYIDVRFDLWSQMSPQATPSASNAPCVYLLTIVRFSVNLYREKSV